MKLILRQIGFSSISSAIAEAGPTTTWNTPLGSPAASTHLANSSAHSGVALAGLSTTGQPAASAGATLRIASTSGKFHGAMAPTTPIGWRITRCRLPSAWFGTTRP